MEFRSYRLGDEGGILTLLSTVFQEKRDLARWRWYYQEGPAGPALIRLALHGGRVVGHRALVPYRIWNGREYAVASQASDAAVHPDYRGRGIFSRLTKEVLAAAKDRGWAFVFSFPNEKSLPLNRRLGWVPRQKLRKWVKPLFPSPLTRGKKGLPALKVAPGVGEEFDPLWELYGGRGGPGLCKDARYLRWRYLAKPGPKNYTLLTWQEGGKIQAYSVLAVAGGRGHLLDFMPGSQDPLIFLRGVEKYLRQRGVYFITLWPVPELPPTPYGLGYIPNPLRAGTLALCPLAGELPPTWRVTAGDTDYA